MEEYIEDPDRYEESWNEIGISKPFITRKAPMMTSSMSTFRPKSLILSTRTTALLRSRSQSRARLFGKEPQEEDEDENLKRFKNLRESTSTAQFKMLIPMHGQAIYAESSRRPSSPVHEGGHPLLTLSQSVSTFISLPFVQPEQQIQAAINRLPVKITAPVSPDPTDQEEEEEEEVPDDIEEAISPEASPTPSPEPVSRPKPKPKPLYDTRQEVTRFLKAYDNRLSSHGSRPSCYRVRKNGRAMPSTTTSNLHQFFSTPADTQGGG